MHFDQLIFHPVTRHHLDAGIAIHCDPETNRFNPFGAPTPERFELALRDWVAHWEAHGFGYWAVSLLQEPQHVVGFGGIMDTTIGTQMGLNLYFRLSPTAWGKGIGSAIADAGLHKAFVERQRDAVLGLVRPKNLPSRKTLEKAGLRMIGRTDDVPGQEQSLIYQITAQEYAQKNHP